MTEENQRENSPPDRLSTKELRKFFINNDTKNEKSPRNFNTEPSHQYLNTGESTHCKICSYFKLKQQSKILKMRKKISSRKNLQLK